MNKPLKIVLAVNIVLFALSFGYGFYKDAPTHKMGMAALALLLAFIFSVVNGAIGSALTLISWRYKPVGDYGTSMLFVCFILIGVWVIWAVLAQ